MRITHVAEEPQADVSSTKNEKEQDEVPEIQAFFY